MLRTLARTFFCIFLFRDVEMCTDDFLQTTMSIKYRHAAYADPAIAAITVISAEFNRVFRRRCADVGIQIRQHAFPVFVMNAALPFIETTTPLLIGKAVLDLPMFRERYFAALQIPLPKAQAGNFGGHAQMCLHSVDMLLRALFAGLVLQDRNQIFDADMFVAH